MQSDELKYCVNCDWLQLYCHDHNPGLLYELNGVFGYEFKLQQYHSRHFKEIWEVLNVDGDKYAIIQRIPCSCILSKDASIIQLCNRELYRKNFINDFLLFLRHHNFVYKNISRIDVCFDSNRLVSCSHRELIDNLMTNKLIKIGSRQKRWNLSGTSNQADLLCESCSFGSLKSDIHVKIYNKTKELSEVHYKPYIVDSWNINGLDTSCDVWRIEISIKPAASKAVKKNTGEIFRLSPKTIMQDLADVFFSYAEKYCVFKINDGTKNITRMKQLVIFPDNIVGTMLPYRCNSKSDTNRSDKIFLKKLLGLREEINLTPLDELNVMNIATTFALEKSLSNRLAGGKRVESIVASQFDFMIELLSTIQNSKTEYKEIIKQLKKLRNDLL